MKTWQIWLREWFSDWFPSWFSWSLVLTAAMLGSEYLRRGQTLSFSFIALFTFACLVGGALGHGVAWLSKKRKEKEQNADQQSI